ncbi:hypothetical protein TNIN_262751 [Trichonephila inaurata madagascariensis]|uniref:Uncharacterized protein n=1 Tax=Trichonephila inaurata madagascariensis TaxID=2747483 RepID=A0A8X6XSS4_9ARAC|nr:hypothetical protein TNIN_262751 [Trichonephila inaurata madagascariensis]
MLLRHRIDSEVYLDEPKWYYKKNCWVRTFIKYSKQIHVELHIIWISGGEDNIMGKFGYMEYRVLGSVAPYSRENYELVNTIVHHHIIDFVSEAYNFFRTNR